MSIILLAFSKNIKSCGKVVYYQSFVQIEIGEFVCVCETATISLFWAILLQNWNLYE